MPLVYLIVRVAEASNVGDALWRARTAQLALGTVALTAVVTVLAIVIGVGLAVAALRVSGGRPAVIGLLATPLAIPSYVTGFAWTRLFPGFEGFWAAVLVMTAACYPLVLLPAAAALAGTGRSLHDVARTLGRGPYRTFAAVTLRQLRPAVLGGGLLVALYVIGDFGGPASVRFESFTVGIYNAYNGAFDRILPAVYSVLLIAAALVLAGLVRLSRRRDAPQLNTTEPPLTGAGPMVRAVGIAAMIATFAVAVIVPVVVLIVEAAQSKRLVGRGVGELWTWLWPSLSSTLSYAVAGAAVVNALAIPIALFTARPRRRAAGLVEQISFLGYTLPGITVGLAVVFVGIRLGRDFYLTPGLLVVGYAILFLPLAVGPVRDGLDATPESLSDVARTLGAGPWGVLLRVRLPLVAPGIAAGAVLAGLAIAKELPATLLLRPLSTSTLATKMWSLSNDGAMGEAAILGLTLIVVAAIPAAILSGLMLKNGARR